MSKKMNSSIDPGRKGALSASKCIPPLRFPEFKGEWEKKKLGEVIISIESGTSVNSIDESITKNYEYGILKTSCISKGEFFSEENKKILDSEISRATLNPVKDSILVSRMNTPQLVGENGYVDKDYYNLFLPDRLWLLKTLSSYPARFLNHVLTTNNLRTAISNIATGTSNSMKNISQPSFLAIESFFPNSQEQTKIATFLTAVDEKLNALKKKKAHLELYKKGVMQKLFPSTGLGQSPEVRFKITNEKGELVEPPDWEVKRLGEVCEQLSSGKDKPNESDFYPIYGSMGVIGYSSKYSFSNKSILIARVGANAGTINIVDGNYGVTDNTLVLISKTDIEIIFLFYLLINQDLNKLVFGSGQPLITAGQLKSIDIKIPSLSEQTKIANFLSAIDEKINHTQSQIEKTEVWKKGLLQKMFV